MRAPARAADVARCLSLALWMLGTLNAYAAPTGTWQGELRLRGDDGAANGRGPLAAAARQDPRYAVDTAAVGRAEAQLTGGWQAGALRADARGLVTEAWADGRQAKLDAQVQELALSAESGDWQTSVGRKLVSWDVAHAFRPNDLVQQESRRALLSAPPSGRPLWQLEHFGAESSLALVWVNPQHLHEGDRPALGPEESALALRVWQRHGAADLHGFARWGRHSGASAGAAVAGVLADDWEVHASGRWMQRHDGWAPLTETPSRPPDSPAATANPWTLGTQGAAAQALLGASWTGRAQQSVLVEWWWDGTAPRDADWRTWNRRNAELQAAPGSPGVAGALAWQATPLDGLFGAPVLRRHNAFVRLAWQPQSWTAALDAWFTPTDGGQVWTASVQWQGDRLRLQAALRQLGGPADAVLAQLPARRSGALMATWSF